MTIASAPALIVPERFRRSLWAIRRLDGRGLITYNDFSQREPGTDPISMLMLWTSADLAERYCAEQIKGTGRPHPIEKDEVIPFLRKILHDTRGSVRWVILNRPPEAATDRESFRTGIAEIPLLIKYLLSGAPLGGQDGRA